MLQQLHIRDIVLIQNLLINFSDGLSVLTGETGAGKSILLDALSLALGARGDGSLVREGAPDGQVHALFNIPEDHSVVAVLHENNLQGEGAVSGHLDILLRRSQQNDGRTRAWINDVPVSVNLLRNVGSQLVEIHGQHDDRALVESSTHRELLDAFGGLESKTEAVRAAWQVWQQVAGELSDLKEKIAKASEESDYLRDCVAELTALAPDEGEETQLAEQRQRMMHAEQIAEDLNEADEVLSGKKSAVPDLSSLVRRLERKTEQMPGLLETVIQNINDGLDHLHEAQAELQIAIRASEFDQGTLESAEERLFALRAASRKYSVPVESLPALAVTMADKVSAIDHGEEQLVIMERRVNEASTGYFELARSLSANRSNVAQALEADVARELPSLKLENAAFIAAPESDEGQAGPTGIDHLEFLVRTNPGTRAGPMFKVASGGELSRFLLALKVALADKGSAPCLVFDEIDTGVGGAVADAIGRRLARLAEKVQVLSVTHAPQVAALAKSHLLISKTANDKETQNIATRVVEIEEDARRNEIARMLSGASITDEARAAAEKLLEAVR